MNPSPKFTLNSVDWKSIGMGALKVMIGALLTYATSMIGHYSYGNYTPAVMWVFTPLTNMAWKFVDCQPAK